MIKASLTQANRLIRQALRKTPSFSLLPICALFFLQTPALPVPELSELSKLKAENHQLKIQVTQCRVDLLDAQAKVASNSLSAEQNTLEQEFRKELKCLDTDKFNWQTLKCEAQVVKKIP